MQVTPEWPTAILKDQHVLTQMLLTSVSVLQETDLRHTTWSKKTTARKQQQETGFTESISIVNNSCMLDLKVGLCVVQAEVQQERRLQSDKGRRHRRKRRVLNLPTEPGSGTPITARPCYTPTSSMRSPTFAGAWRQTDGCSGEQDLIKEVTQARKSLSLAQKRERPTICSVPWGNQWRSLRYAYSVFRGPVSFSFSFARKGITADACLNGSRWGQHNEMPGASPYCSGWQMK